MASGVLRLEHMVQQLLELSKMESAGLNLEKQPFVFSEIVQELVHSFSLTSQEKKISIECINCENTAWIYADIHMMERVIQNLLTNAIKFTHENGKICISLYNHAGELTFLISNKGEAMSTPLLGWLEDNKTDSSSRPHNHGLGLLIVKTILQLHNFPIKAEFKIDEGNIISFRMPITNPALS
jgi:K+-sensing histidine kinase KdpD